MKSFFIVLLLVLISETRNCFANNSADTVSIGVVAGLTGEFASSFQDWVDGISLAAEEHATRGGRPRVDLFVEDDEFKASVGLSAYRKLTEVHKVQAIFNGSSTTIGAIKPLVTKLGIPVIQLGEETDLTLDDNIFQIMPGNIAMQLALGAYMSSHCPEQLVLFHTIHSTILRFVNAFRSGYSGQAKVVELAPSASDLRSLVTRATARNIDCIVIIAVPTQGAQIVRELKQLGQLPSKLAFDGIFQSGYQDYQSILGGLDDISKAIVVALDSPVDTEFKEKFKKKYGRNSGPMADLGYDGFNLLMTTYDPIAAKWIDKIKRINLQGASSKISFDPLGIRQPQFKITTVGELGKSLKTNS